MNRRLVTIIVLLIMVAGSWWVLNPASDRIDTADSELLSAGYYLVDATIADTDDAGDLIYSLRAQRIDHNPRDESVTLEALQLLYALADDERWQIRATEGWMDGARTQMIFRGKVQITGDFESNTSTTTINTTRLILDLQENIAHTNEAVQIVISGGVLEATGLHADFKNQKIRLLSDVHGTFDVGT